MVAASPPAPAPGAGEARDLCTGSRVLLGNHAATVRYIGDVSGQTGQWVGLEWDDASRGKNDGSVDGHRYFR